MKPIILNCFRNAIGYTTEGLTLNSESYEIVDIDTKEKIKWSDLSSALYDLKYKNFEIIDKGNNPFATTNAHHYQMTEKGITLVIGITSFGQNDLFIELRVPNTFDETSELIIELITFEKIKKHIFEILVEYFDLKKIKEN